MGKASQIWLQVSKVCLSGGKVKQDSTYPLQAQNFSLVLAVNWQSV